MLSSRLSFDQMQTSDHPPADTRSTGRRHRREIPVPRSTARSPSTTPTAAAVALVVLAITIFTGTSTSATSTTPTASAATPARSTVNCSPGVPEKDCRAAEVVYKFAVSHNYAAPPGLKGNAEYSNNTGRLPAGGDYREYRLHSTPGSAERLVIDRDNPEGNSWFTHDHYQTFVQFYLTL